MIKVLLIEDNGDDAELIVQSLKEADVADGTQEIEVERVDRLIAGLARLTADGIDVVLLDMNLPDSSGLDTFLSVHVNAPHVPVVIVSGNQDLEIATQAVYKGAEDYLVKGQFSGGQLLRSLNFAISRHARNAANREIQKATATLGEMVQALRALRGETEQVVTVMGDINANLKGTTKP